MLLEMGYCNGIENYSPSMDVADPGQPPYTLLDFFPKDSLFVVDSSILRCHKFVGCITGIVS